MWASTMVRCVYSRSKAASRAREMGSEGVRERAAGGWRSSTAAWWIWVGLCQFGCVLYVCVGDAWVDLGLLKPCGWMYDLPRGIEMPISIHTVLNWNWPVQLRWLVIAPLFLLSLSRFVLVGSYDPRVCDLYDAEVVGCLALRNESAPGIPDLTDAADSSGTQSGC